MFFRTAITIFIVSILFPQVAEGKEHVVEQKGKAFTVKEITIKVGDSVSFLNSDPFFHNVFSLSDTKFFDLGSYPEGEAKSVTFDKPGEVAIECAIHPEMRMTVKVTE